VDKRRLDDTEKRSAVLFDKLQDGSISLAVFEKLQHLCQGAYRPIDNVFYKSVCIDRYILF